MTSGIDQYTYLNLDSFTFCKLENPFHQPISLRSVFPFRKKAGSTVGRLSISSTINLCGCGMKGLWFNQSSLSQKSFRELMGQPISESFTAKCIKAFSKKVFNRGCTWVKRQNFSTRKTSEKRKRKALPFDLFSYLKWSMKPLFMIWSTESTRKIVPNPLHLKEL